jgi:hypothetical protein
MTTTIPAGASAGAAPMPSATPEDIYLDEATAFLAATLESHQIDRITATVATVDGAHVISDIKAHRDHAEPFDLAATPIASGHGKHHRTYHSLLLFVQGYLERLLSHRPDPFLCDGELVLYRTGFVSQPLHYAAKWAAEAQKRAAEMQATKDLVIPALARLGIVTVVAAYDGEGDGGQIDSIEATAADDSAIALDGHAITLPNDETWPLADVLDEVLWDCLSIYHDGFENNEGGYGTITIQVADGKIIIDHNDRIIAVDNTVTEL